MVHPRRPIHLLRSCTLYSLSCIGEKKITPQVRGHEMETARLEREGGTIAPSMRDANSYKRRWGTEGWKREEGRGDADNPKYNSEFSEVATSTGAVSQ